MTQELKTTEGMVFGLSAELTTAENRIAELESALRAAIALIRTDDHPTRQGMADNLQKTLEG